MISKTSQTVHAVRTVGIFIYTGGALVFYYIVARPCESVNAANRHKVLYFWCVDLYTYATKDTYTLITVYFVAYTSISEAKITHHINSAMVSSICALDCESQGHLVSLFDGQRGTNSAAASYYPIMSISVHTPVHTNCRFNATPDGYRVIPPIRSFWGQRVWLSGLRGLRAQNRTIFPNMLFSLLQLVNTTW